MLPELQQEFPGLQVSVEGSTQEAATTQASLQTAMLIGVLGIFVLLSFQFRSYSQPLIVMLAIPFALIGVICPLEERAVFVKMVGPMRSVQGERSAFLEFCESLEFGE